MIIHKFNQKGYDTYKRIVEDIQSSVEKENNDISKGYTKELKKRIKDLQSDTSTQEKFEYNISFEVKNFDNRHELGIYLDQILKQVPTYELVDNFYLWDWISLQFFEKIFTEKGTASDWRFRLINDHKLKFRNLIYTPWWLLRHYQKEDSRIFLTRLELNVGGDWIEQFMKKNHVRNYKKIAHICHILFYDEEEKRDIPGTSKSNLGALQDFCDEIKYLNLIYDLFQMPDEMILKKLPDRFFKYMRKIGKEVKINNEIFN